MHHQPHSGMAGPLAVSPHCEPSAEPSLQAHCTGVTHSGREFVGSGRRKGALGSYRDRPKALGSPVLLVPSPRETPAVHCASPFFLFQGPRGPDGPAGEQGSQGLKVWIPVTCPFYHLPCWVRHPGSRAHTLLCRRPLEESPKGCRAVPESSWGHPFRPPLYLQAPSMGLGEGERALRQ